MSQLRQQATLNDRAYAAWYLQTMLRDHGICAPLLLLIPAMHHVLNAQVMVSASIANPAYCVKLCATVIMQLQGLRCARCAR